MHMQVIRLLTNFFSTLFFLFSFYSSCFAQWTNLNTGIDDNLTGVVFHGTNGIVSGEKGVYYTTTGGNGPASWTRFNIAGNTNDSILYNNIQFRHAFSISSTSSNNLVWVCGKDTVNNVAVIMKFSLPAMTYSWVYTGPINTGLNNIAYCQANSTLYAVGDNGLFVSFTQSTNGTQLITTLNQDLSAISFSSNTFSCATSGHQIYGTVNGASLQFTTLLAPGMVFKDTHRLGAGSFFYTGSAFHRSLSGSLNTYNEFDFGPLKGQGMAYYLSNYYIGTDHGIFKQVNTNYRLEWQPSSGNNSIKDFWYDLASTTNFYACGKNGVLLFTTNSGGLSKPYATIAPLGACSGQGTVVTTAIPGSGSSCSWTLNGNWVSGTCSSLSYTTSVPGAYALKYISSNGTYSDTAYGTLNIVIPPQFNLPYSVADTILCQAEPLEITIPNSEPNVFYSLYKFGSSTNYGSSPVSAGGNMTFTTNVINTPGNYYIKATSGFANCSKNFTDTIHVLIEKTNADFHVGLINAEINENTPFYEQTVDAQNFAWTFINQSDTLTSSLANPIIPFSNTGTTSVQLIASSINGCSDTLAKNGPRVIQLPSDIDSCWVNKLKLSNPVLTMAYDLVKIASGYLVLGSTGTGNQESKFGDSLEYIEKGSYLSKFDLDGTLKWTLKTKVLNLNNQSSDFVSAVEDSSHNLYVCGSNGYFIVDNSGDTIVEPYNFSYYIAKLDQYGKMLWRITSDKYRPRDLSLDNQGNLLISGALASNASADSIAHFRFNNFPTDTLLFQFELYANDRAILKVDSSGTILWHFGIVQENSSGVSDFEIKCDAINNFYLVGSFGNYVYLHSSDFSTTQVLTEPVQASGGHVYIAKYNEQGILQWGVKSVTVGPPLDQTLIYDFEVDSSGAIFLTGRNDCNPLTNYFQMFSNTDGTVTTTIDGKYFIAKMNTDGICEWVQGGAYSYYGMGKDVVLKGDEVISFALFQSFNNGLGNPANVFISSTDSSSIYIDAFFNTIYMIVYDHAGKLKRVIPSDDMQENFIVSTELIVGVELAEDGSFFLCRDMAGYITPLHYIYGTLIDSDSAITNCVVKFREECAPYPLFPSFNLVTHHDVCYGEGIILENGLVLSNLLSDTTIIENLVSINGLDSIHQNIIHVLNPQFVQVQENVCYGSSYTFQDGYSLPSVIDTLSHQIVLTSLISGCDSIVTVFLNVVLADTTASEIYICPHSSYTFPNGTTLNNINTPLNYTSVLPSIIGCDSVIITQLYLYETDTSYAVTEVCSDSSFTFPDGTTITNILTQQTNWSTIPSSIGCDSVIKTTVNPHVFNTTLEYNGGVLSSNETQTNYQWVDCNNNFAPIQGATSIQFVPSIIGTYAVELSSNGCTDISSCFTIEDLSMSELDKNQSVFIFPNPSNGVFAIEFISSVSNSTVEIRDLSGRIIYSDFFVETDEINVSLDLSNGSYFLQIINENSVRKMYKIEVVN